MARNDPVTGLENIVQLPQPHHSPVASLRPHVAPMVPFDHWAAQRDAAAAALLSGSKRLLVTGPAGTGKTVLVDHVARVLRAAGRTVVIELADTDPVPPPADTTLFVDEADRLSNAKLRALLAAPGRLVLAGLGTLATRVPSGTVHLTLAPLEQEAARAYIAGWLALTGRVPADVDSLAVRRLVEVSGGVPRLLSTLLGSSAWLAKASGSAVIGAAHVQEAAELRSVVPAGPSAATIPQIRRRSAWGSVLLAMVVLTGTAVAVLPRLFPGRVHQVVAGLSEHAEHLGFRVQSTLASLVAAPSVPAATPAVMVLPSTPPPPEAIVVVTPPVISMPMVSVPVVSVPAISMPSQSLPVETVEFLLRRGQEMMGLNDITAARLLFRRAADAGSGEAMLELGQTYDPSVLISIGALRLADHEQAKLWYESAAATGNVVATRRLETK